MPHSMLKSFVVVGVTGAFLAGCASVNPFSKPDPRWADFESWTKVTEGVEPTGDPTGTLQVVHKGPTGYRDVYVNDIGKDVLLGAGPYDFPEGTVVVKHQFDNKADWESGKNGDVTVSVKATDDGTRNKDNWVWAASYKGKAVASEFCSSCHTAALGLSQSDYVFTTGNFMKKHFGE